MKSSIPLFVVEPSGHVSRRALSATLLGLSPPPSLQELRSRIRAGLLYRHVYYIDEYLVRLTHECRLTPELVRVNQSVLCHIPCHLKVHDEGRSTLELLHSIPGLSVATVNVTCCGMGGYHGYRKPYSGLSLEIGRKLFRDIEETCADGVITGCAACGLQIGFGTGIAVTHPVQLLEMAYGLDS